MSVHVWAVTVARLSCASRGDAGSASYVRLDFFVFAGLRSCTFSYLVLMRALVLNSLAFLGTFCSQR